MSRKSLLSKLAVAVSLGAATTGCTIVDKSYDQVRTDITSTMDEMRRNGAVGDSHVEEIDDIWFGGEPFRISENVKAPSILNRKVQITQIEPVSASDIITQLSRDLGFKIVMSQDAIEYTEHKEDQEGGGDQQDGGGSGGDNKNKSGSKAPYRQNETSGPADHIRFSVDYEGTVSGLLDLISTKAGLFWRWESGEVVMRRYETKTYLVDVVSGKVDFSSVMKSDLSAVSQSNGDNALGSTDSYHEVKMAINAKTSWEAMEQSIQSMLSRRGKIATAETVGTITVTDTPQVQRRVAEYIKRTNAIASKQIAIKAEVLEISSDENGNFDTNIMGMFDWNGDLKISLDGAQKIAFGIGGDRANSAMNNKWSDNSEASLQALRQNKNVSLVTSSMVYAMNGQPTPFQQLDEVGYVSETSVSDSSSSSDSETSTPMLEMKPGRTSQGISMLVIPRILSDGRVMMNFAVDSSRINSIDPYGVEGGPQVQLPNRSLNKYQQIITVHSGKPLMIAGVERTEHHAAINSKAGRNTWLFGGSQKGGQRKIMTMIILTPYIMSK